jgi:uncharacterized membrane protein
VDKSRFEAFSDGVFAFAITLLVLGVVLPQLHQPSEAQLSSALYGLWPNIVAYVLSFAVIGIMWQNHHALFRMIARVDRMTVFLNLLLLAATAFIPFATSTLGTYPTMRSSTFLYGLVLTLCATAYNLMLLHLVRRRAFHASVGDETILATIRAYRVGWVGYALAMLLAMIDPLASFVAYLLIAAYYVIPRGLDSDTT